MEPTLSWLTYSSSSGIMESTSWAPKKWTSPFPRQAEPRKFGGINHNNNNFDFMKEQGELGERTPQHTTGYLNQT